MAPLVPDQISALKKRASAGRLWRCSRVWRSLWAREALQVAESSCAIPLDALVLYLQRYTSRQGRPIVTSCWASLQSQYNLISVRTVARCQSMAFFIDAIGHPHPKVYRFPIREFDSQYHVHGKLRDARDCLLQDTGYFGCEG